MAFLPERAAGWLAAFAACTILLSVLPAPAAGVSAPELYARYFASGEFASIEALAGEPTVEVWLNASKDPALVTRAFRLANGSVERDVETGVQALRAVGERWLNARADAPDATRERDAFGEASSALVARGEDCLRGVSVFLSHPNSVAYRNLVIEKNLHRKDEWAALLVLNATRANFTRDLAAFDAASGRVASPSLSNASKSKAMSSALEKEFAAFNQTLDVMQNAQTTIQAAYVRSFDEGLDKHTCGLTANESRALRSLSRLRFDQERRTVDAFVTSVLVRAQARVATPTPAPAASVLAATPAAPAPPAPDAGWLVLAGVLSLALGATAGALARRAQPPAERAPPPAAA